MKNLEEGKSRFGENEDILPKDTLAALEKLGAILLPIRLRMRSEGYDIINGQVVKIFNQEQANEEGKNKQQN